MEERPYHQDIQDHQGELKLSPRRKSNETLKTILVKFIKCFGAGALAKFLFAMIQNKLKLAKVLNNPQPILRFALMSGFFSFLYKITRYLIKFFRLKLSKDMEVFLASMSSSTALFLADQKDMNLLKLLILPRALESVYCLLEERGIVKPIPHGPTLLHISGIVVTVYFFIHEPFNLEPSMRRSVTSYMNLIPGEKDLKDTFTNIMLNNIKVDFPRHRLNQHLGQ